MIIFDNVIKIRSDDTSIKTGFTRNGKYYYEYTFIKDCDIMDNIKVEVSPNIDFAIYYVIGGQVCDFETATELLLLSAEYHDFKLRILFDTRPHIDIKFTIYSRKYLMKQEHIDWSIRYPIETYNMKYIHGTGGTRRMWEQTSVY